MRQVLPKAGTVIVYTEEGLGKAILPAQLIGSLAVLDDGSIVHIATGRFIMEANRAVTKEESLRWAQHANREVRWTWANSLTFGDVAKGRGATMLRKSMEAAVASFPAKSD